MVGCINFHKSITSCEFSVVFTDSYCNLDKPTDYETLEFGF